MGCRAKNTDNAPPLEHITVTMTEVNFGSSLPDYIREIPLVITNTGQLKSTVTIPEVSGGVFTLTGPYIDDTPYELLPQEILTVTITFKGQTPTPPALSIEHTEPFQINTSAGETPFFIITINGISTLGSHSTKEGFTVGLLSEPSEHDDNDIIFVNGTNDELIRYDVGSDHTLSMPIDPAFGKIMQRAYGRPGSKQALLIRSGGDDIEGTDDDLLTLVSIEAASFSEQNFPIGLPNSGEGGFSSDLAGAPVELQPGVFAVITGGATNPDFGTDDDRLSFFNTNTGNVTHYTIGYIDDSALACRPSGDSSGTVSLCSSGADGTWNNGNESVWLLRFDSTTESVTDFSLDNLDLDETLSECGVWGVNKTVFLRYGASGMDFVYMTNGGVNSFKADLSFVSRKALLTNVSLDGKVGEWLIPTTTNIPPIDSKIHLLSNYLGVMDIHDTLDPYPLYDTTPDAEIISAFRPTGILAEFTDIEFGSQTLGLAGSDSLNVLTITQPIFGPINLIPISVPVDKLSGRPNVSDNKEWAALSSSKNNEVVVVSFLESTPFVGTFSLAGLPFTLDTGLVSRSLMVGNSVVVALSATDDKLIRIDLPIP